MGRVTESIMQAVVLFWIGLVGTVLCVELGDPEDIKAVKQSFAVPSDGYDHADSLIDNSAFFPNLGETIVSYLDQYEQHKFCAAYREHETDVYSHLDLAQRQVYYGNPRVLLPELQQLKPGLMGYNTNVHSKNFISLQPGLEVPIDDNEIWPHKHQTEVQIGVTDPRCQPQLYWAGANGRVAIRWQPNQLRVKYLETKRVWQLRFVFGMWRSGPITQVFLAVPHVAGVDCRYQLRTVIRMDVDPLALQLKLPPRPMAQRRCWHPAIQVWRFPEQTRWVPLVFHLYLYTTAVTQVLWYYPLSHVINPKYEFVYDADKWGHWKHLYKFYDAFTHHVDDARLMSVGYTTQQKKVVAFYNFLVHLAKVLRIPGCELLRRVETHLVAQGIKVYYLTENQTMLLMQKLNQYRWQEFFTPQLQHMMALTATDRNRGQPPTVAHE